MQTTTAVELKRLLHHTEGELECLARELERWGSRADMLVFYPTPDTDISVIPVLQGVIDDLRKLGREVDQHADQLPCPNRPRWLEYIIKYHKVTVDLTHEWQRPKTVENPSVCAICGISSSHSLAAYICRKSTIRR